MKHLRLMDYFAKLKQLLGDQGRFPSDKYLTEMAVMYRNAGYSPEEAAEMECE